MSHTSTSRNLKMVDLTREDSMIHDSTREALKVDAAMSIKIHEASLEEVRLVEPRHGEPRLDG